jgi:hypothetical protein
MSIVSAGPVVSAGFDHVWLSGWELFIVSSVHATRRRPADVSVPLRALLVVACALVSLPLMAVVTRPAFAAAPRVGVPAAAYVRTVDDTDPSVTYFADDQSSDWSHEVGLSCCYNGTESETFGYEDSARLTFIGTSITWWAPTLSSASEVSVYIDGVNQPSGFVAQPIGPIERIYRVYVMSNLSPGTHTIQLVNRDLAEPLTLDAFTYTPVTAASTDGNASAEAVVDDDGTRDDPWQLYYQPVLSFRGAWSKLTGTGSDYRGTESFTAQLNDTVTFTFYGSSVSWWGRRQNNLGMAQVLLDWRSVATVDQYSPTPIGALTQQELWSRTGLPMGWHTLQLRNLGADGGSGGPYLLVDAFSYQGSTLVAVGGTSIDDKRGNGVGYDPASAWHQVGTVDSYDQTETETETYGATVTVPFVGGTCTIFGPIDNAHGAFRVALDGRIVGTFTEFGPNSKPRKNVPVTPAIIANPGTPLEGRHILQITSLVSAPTNFSFDRALCH